MRKIAPDFNASLDDDDDDDESDPTVGYADWKDSPETVLDAIDTLLEAHGLEVVIIETGADDYKFKIEKRQP